MYRNHLWASLFLLHSSKTNYYYWWYHLTETKPYKSQRGYRKPQSKNFYPCWKSLEIINCAIKMYKFSRYFRAVENKVVSLSCVFEIAPICNWINTSRMRNRWFMTWIICSKSFSLWNLEWVSIVLTYCEKIQRQTLTMGGDVEIQHKSSRWRPKTIECMPSSLHQQLPCFFFIYFFFLVGKTFFFLYFKKLKEELTNSLRANLLKNYF